MPQGSLSPNQLVAYNLRRARDLRGWTQEVAAEHLQAHLGERWSRANWSAAERSVDGQRVRQFDANEIVAFARTFELPVTWFFLPPGDDLPGAYVLERVSAHTVVGVDPASFALGLLRVNEEAVLERVASLASASEVGELPRFTRLVAMAAMKRAVADLSEQASSLRQLAETLDEVERFATETTDEVDRQVIAAVDHMGVEDALRKFSSASLAQTVESFGKQRSAQRSGTRKGNR